MPTMLDYRVHVENKSLYNTPNTWGIYIMGLVCKWLEDQGGLAGMEELNEAKAQLLYDAIDATDFYRGHADVDCRSPMNVTFRLPSEELEKKFAAEATAQGLVYVVEEACKVKKISLRGATVAIQGFGNAGATAARLLAEKKVKIIALSDTRGGVTNSRGIDPLKAIRYKER